MPRVRLTDAPKPSLLRRLRCKARRPRRPTRRSHRREAARDRSGIRAVASRLRSPKDAPRWQRIVRAVHRLGHGLVLHDVLLAAPAMAFHFFLSLLPLLVFVGYVVGLIARRRGVDAVLSPLLDNLPGTAESVVKKEVERLAGAAAPRSARSPPPRSCGSPRAARTA